MRIRNLLPARMDLAFRNKIVSQINRLNRNKLCRRIYITDVVPIPKMTLKDGTMMAENGVNRF